MGEDAAASQGLDRSKVEHILRAAFKAGASDVHFKAGERVLLRIRGRLQALNAPPLQPADTLRLLRTLRPAHVPEAEIDSLQELDFSFGIAGIGRFRVNAFRQRGSVALVVRIIPLEIPVLADLDLPQVLEALADEARGLILVTGTTGSGKSTTLAAMIHRINQLRTAHVVTIEDPIEFYFRNQRSSIVQREIGSDTSSFAVALRAALRQDPDVIMIGEMRDPETIDIALKAAETGHLVLSSVHTTDAQKTVQRILSAYPLSEQGIVRVRLAECLRAVVSQRLLPRADGSGVVPAVEVMVATRAIQECVRDAERTAQMGDLIAQGRSYGMQTFDQSLYDLLCEGRIAREVALLAATSPTDLELKLRMGADDDDGLAIDSHMYDAQQEEKALTRFDATATPSPASAAAPPPPATDAPASPEAARPAPPPAEPASSPAVGSYGLRRQQLRER